MKKILKFFVVSEFFLIFVKQLAIMNIEKRFANTPARKKQIIENYLDEKFIRREAIQKRDGMYIPSERVEIPKKLISLKNSYDNMSPSKDKNYGDLRNGFQCPDCGKELSDLKNSGILESMPAQKQVVCKCGFQGTRYVTD